MPIMPCASPSRPTSPEEMGNVVACGFCVLRNYNSCQPLRSPLVSAVSASNFGGGDGICSWRERLRRDNNYPSQQARRQRSLRRRLCVLPRRSLGSAVRKGCEGAASPDGCSPFPHPTQRSFQTGTGSSCVGRCLAGADVARPGRSQGSPAPVATGAPARPAGVRGGAEESGPGAG